MLEQTDAIMNKVLEPITFAVSYPTVFSSGTKWNASIYQRKCCNSL